MRVNSPEWRRTVDGYMKQLDVCREDAQFMYDFDRHLVPADESLLPMLQRVYGGDVWHARELLELYRNASDTDEPSDDPMTYPKRILVFDGSGVDPEAPRKRE